jgi:adenine-specific DNA methylase
MDFIEAEYVAPAGGPGRSKAENPFTDVIADIALKLDPNGKPLARALVFEHEDRSAEDSNFKRLVNGFKRQLSDAGANNDPQVTVMSVITPVANPVNKKESATKSKLTFWTVKRQTRTKKSNGADGSTSNEQSVAVAAPVAA